MKEWSDKNEVEFLLDNEFFLEVHARLTAIEAADVAENTYLRIAMWSADLKTALPDVPNQKARTLQEALSALNEKGHEVRVILWHGSTVSGVTGYKEHQKATVFQKWAKDKEHIDVYLEPYKSAMGASFGSKVGTVVGFGLGYLLGYDTTTSTNIGTALGTLSGMTNAFGWGASTHQKIVIWSMAGELSSIVGGFNLGSEYSCEPNHAIDDQYWHDTAVVLTGPAAATVHNEWVRKWNKQGSDRAFDEVKLSTQPTTGTSSITIATTNSESSSRENHIRELMVERIGLASKFIYIENYALTDPALVEALVARLSKSHKIPVVVMINHPKSELFEANTTWSYFQTDVFDKLKKANGGKSVMYGARTKNERKSSKGVTYRCWPYPHSKLAIFDDHTLVVGSANWTYRSMEYDGEISAFIYDSKLVPDVRKRLFWHWWRKPDGAGPKDMSIDTWVREADKNSHHAPLSGCKILRLRAEDFEDWQELSKKKQVFLSTAWTMF